MGFRQHGRWFASAHAPAEAAPRSDQGTRAHRARFAPWHHGAWLGLVALVASGCQPRPRFKVDVANIDAKTTSLQVSLWLGNTSPAAGILSNGYTDLLAQTPPSGFGAFTVPDCGTAEKNCAQDKRDYSFGVTYATDANQARHTALVGIAAADATGCLRNVLTGEITDPAELGDPQTLPLSLLHGTVDTSTCVKGELIITDVAAEFDVRVSGASPIHLLIVNGWGFKPDATLMVSDGCTSSQIKQTKLESNQTLQPSDATVVSVTPTQIVAQLGSIDVLRSSCGVGPLTLPKSVAVVVGPASSPVTSPVFTVR